MSNNEPTRRTEEVWWNDWFDADFSWSGLAEKKAHDLTRWESITQEAPAAADHSLQNYWRISPVSGKARSDEELIAAGELIAAPDGALWHIAHVPIHWRNGAAAKEAWDQRQRKTLQDVLQARLKLAKATTAGLSGVSVTDCRAKFVGVIFADAPAHPDGSSAPLHLDARWSWIRWWAQDDLTFGPSAIFDNACLVDVRISHAHFLGHASFTSVVVTECILMSFAIFDGYASFDCAELAEADFARSQFNDGADFRACKFHGFAEFTESKFEEAWFHDTLFAGSADFSACNFRGDVTFQSAHFKSAVSFAQCKFGGTAKFSDMRWPANPGNWESAFSDATFSRRAWFTHSNRVAFSAFNGANFEKGADLPDLTEREFLLAFREEIRLASNTELVEPWLTERNAHLGYYYQHAREDFDWKMSADLDWNQVWLTSLEAGCRSLRSAARSNSESPTELVLYRLELLARRAKRSTPIWQKIALGLYECTSASGTSMLQPLASLAAVLIGFAIAFFVWASVAGTAGGDQVASGWEAATYSWQNIFRPFAAAGNEAAGVPSMDRLFLQGAATEFGVRALATLESFAAISLVFLFGLAARRHFQLGS